MFQKYQSELALLRSDKARSLVQLALKTMLFAQHKPTSLPERLISIRVGNRIGSLKLSFAIVFPIIFRFRYLSLVKYKFLVPKALELHLGFKMTLFGDRIKK